MFSPILAMVSAMASAIVMLPTLAALILSTSVPVVSATPAIIFTKPWNRSLRATKSVSELTSTTTPLVPWTCTPIRPSAATRPAFLAAFDRPFLRSQSCAACISPSVSVSAALQSIMPAPVDSRSSLTIWAVIFAIAFLLRGQFLGLRDPAVNTAGQTHFFADIVRGFLVELGDLAVVEDAKIVELLLDCRRNAGQFIQIVGHAARPRQLLEAEVAWRRRGRHRLDDRLFGSTDVDARF